MRRGSCYVIAFLATLAGCERPPLHSTVEVVPEPLPVTTPEPKSELGRRVINLCERYPLVYVLADDGWIYVANVADLQFGPPLANLPETVEMECAERICGRDAYGIVRCIDVDPYADDYSDADQDGLVRAVENLGPTTCLHGNCAVTEEGELRCWNAHLVAEHFAVPGYGFGPDLEITDLHRVTNDSDASCALTTLGVLWCWARSDDPIHLAFFDPPLRCNDHTEVCTFAAKVFAEIPNPKEVDELMFADAPCWRIDDEWTCVSKSGQLFPGQYVAGSPDCDQTGCDCTFHCPDDVCKTRACGCYSDPGVVQCGPPGTIEIDDLWSVRGMVILDHPCLLDREGRAWCKSNGGPPHQIQLPPLAAP